MRIILLTFGSGALLEWLDMCECTKEKFSGNYEIQLRGNINPRRIREVPPPC